jgi:hypothetical protein
LALRSATLATTTDSNNLSPNPSPLPRAARTTPPPLAAASLDRYFASSSSSTRHHRLAGALTRRHAADGDWPEA